jgi:hypothetical protein
MHFEFFSPAQCVGYIACVLGVIAFLQKVDWKLKLFNSFESMAYVAHFLLLGNPAAVVSALLSSVRSLLAVKIRSKTLAVIFIVANLGIGIYVMKSPMGLLPVIGSCMATWAAFVMCGIPMRVMYLLSTFFWLMNNILSGSVGGTVLECFILTANAITITRMLLTEYRARKRMAEAGVGPRL